MPTKKIKIEVYDGEGNKLSISFQGRLTRNRVLQLIEFTELLGGLPPTGSEDNRDLSPLSKFEKLKLVIKRRFPIGWFTTQEALIAYEDTLNEPIGLSTISTYLKRLAGLGFLSRAGSRSRYRFKIKRKEGIREKQRIQP